MYFSDACCVNVLAALDVDVLDDDAFIIIVETVFCQFIEICQFARHYGITGNVRNFCEML